MLADLRNNVIWYNTLSDKIHEIVHLLTGSSKHDHMFLDLYHELGGVGQVVYDNVLDRALQRIGMAANVGNVTGIQNILTDYFLLQAYRKFSQRILGTEGQWEVKGDNKIRLFPTPRGAYPVFIEYIPMVTRLPNPTAKEILKRKMVAEAKIILGNARSKFGNIPAPDGGSLNLNGDALRQEGEAERKQALDDAIKLSEPLGVYTW